MQLVTDQSVMTAILEWKTIKHDPYIDHAHELGLDPMQVYEAPNGERATGREIAKMHYYRLHWNTPVSMDITTFKKVPS